LAVVGACAAAALPGYAEPDVLERPALMAFSPINFQADMGVLLAFICWEC
jgi:hypothetical protein